MPAEPQQQPSSRCQGRTRPVRQGSRSRVPRSQGRFWEFPLPGPCVLIFRRQKVFMILPDQNRFHNSLMWHLRNLLKHWDFPGGEVSSRSPHATRHLSPWPQRVKPACPRARALQREKPPHATPAHRTLARSAEHPAQGKTTYRKNTEKTSGLTRAQAGLRDIVGSAPDHPKKASIRIK